MSKAEKALYLSKQAIKKQIESLEEEAGFALLVRTRQGILLTPSGEEFCRGATCTRSRTTGRRPKFIFERRDLQMLNANAAERPKAKLTEIVNGEAFRLKIPMEDRDATGPDPVFSGSANSYLVRSGNGRWVIIDPGYCSKTGIDGWSKVIEELAIGPDEIECILITHYHPDHSGMAGWFSKWTDAPVYMHPNDISAYSNAWEDRAKSAEEAARQMREYGMDGRMASVAESQLKTRAIFISPCKDFQPMEDGSEFPVLEGTLRVLHTPGHSDGHCVLLWLEKGLLFSADLLLPTTFTPICLHHYGDRNPVDTILATLRDFVNRVTDKLAILPGHGWPFEDPAGRAALQAEYYAERIEWYYQKCAQGMDTAWKIALELYNETGGKRKLRSVMGEAMAYLEYLAEKGRVNREARSDGLHFPICTGGLLTPHALF